MDLNLAGKRVLVTGASAGLGAACARALVEEGATVVINSRDRERLETTAVAIAKAVGVKPGIADGDVSKPADRLKIVNAAREQVADGVIDILVSNTGGPPPGLFLDHPGNAWTEAGRLLLESAVGLTRALLPDMVENQWGRLIYITSVAVLQPVDDLILSNSYRAGVTGFCKTIANTYGQYGITANCVCPGFTATERLTRLMAKWAADGGTTVEEMSQRMTAQVPVRRLGKPQELAALVAFLASDKAAYISGSSIAVDGGVHRGLL
jgi:3-oxoacyl-[acyl-carrier protein] reductase